MGSTEVYLSYYHCVTTGKEFTVASFARDLSQEYGQKYYVTEVGEAAIVDLIKAEPAGMKDLDHYVEALWNEFGPQDPLNDKAKVQQAAWRFFADLSHEGHLWYFERMKGHPVCGLLIMRKVEDLDDTLSNLYVNATSVGGKKLMSTLQPVAFTKWLGLSDLEKQRWMQWFLTSPQYYDVRTLSDPIFPHPFHPELHA